MTKGRGTKGVTAYRWLFGDQLGPHFVEDTTDGVLLIESRAVFRRRSIC